jgi:hypothetical protein
MERKIIEVEEKKAGEISAYLSKNSNRDKAIAYLGSAESQKSPRYDFYMYNNCGIVLHNTIVTIWGKNDNSIIKAFSKLEKKSEGY